MHRAYDYTINKVASNTSFKQTCEKVEKFFPEWNKKELLIDVDGSLIQIYWKNNQRIDVFNDYEVDAVYVESDVCLNMLFGNPIKR